MATRPESRTPEPGPPADTVNVRGRAPRDTDRSPEGGAPDALAGVPPELAGHPNYEVVRELGRGGMGVVYLARNVLMDRLEVLKVLNRSLVGKADAIERFVQEIRSAARLNHPNVVTAYNAQLVGELLVLAMEFVEGDDLSKVVKVKGPLPVPFACHCVREAALGLQRGHELGLVHRDIKPGNLILTRQGKRSTVKIVDFGLAKARAETPSEQGLTATNQMMGTLGYTAPEQLRDARSADTRADIYGLGCTLYFLLAGGVPFQGASAYEVFLAQEAQEVKPLREVRPEVPEALAAVVARMMAKNPADRFSQPREVAEALLPFMRPGAAPVPPPAAAPPAGPLLDTLETVGSDVREAVPKTKSNSNAQRFTAARPAADDTAREPVGPRAPREKSRRPRPAISRKSSRVPRRAGLVALLIGVALLSAAVAGAAFYFFWMPPGETVLVDNVPPDAWVEVEGQPVMQSRDGPLVTVTGVRPGPHRVIVMSDGQEKWSKDVMVQPHGRPLRIRMEPPSPAGAEKAAPVAGTAAPGQQPARPRAGEAVQPAEPPDARFRRPPPPPRQGPNGEPLPPPPRPGEPPPGAPGWRPPAPRPGALPPRPQGPGAERPGPPG